MRRFFRSQAYLWFLIFLLIFIIAGQHFGWFKQASESLKLKPGYYRVTKFDDGDTLRVNMNGSEETVRFIGVDTPETHDPRKTVQCFGYAAADFTKNLIGTQAVRLEADPLNINRDRYNRLLRYVYFADGRLVNAEIIKQGYGFAYVSFPFAKLDEFRKYKKIARKKNKGLWGKCEPATNKYGGFDSNQAE